MLHPRYTKPTAQLSLQREIQERIATVFYDGRIVARHTEYEHRYEDAVDGKIYSSVTTKIAVLDKSYLKQWAVNKAIDHMIDHVNQNDVFDRASLLLELQTAKFAHEKRFNEAGIWGHDGHNVVDVYVTNWIKTGKRPDISILEFADDDISNEGKCAALSACKFFDAHTLFPIVSECKVLSKKYGYAGTLDSLWLIGDVYKGREGNIGCVHSWLEKRKDTIHCATCGREEKLSLIMIDIKTSNQIIGFGNKAHHDYAAQVSAYTQALKEMVKITCKRQWIVRLGKVYPEYEVAEITDPKSAFQLFLSLSATSDYIRSGIQPLTSLKEKKQIVE